MEEWLGNNELEGMGKETATHFDNIFQRSPLGTQEVHKKP
jgi:hypothetical protein